MLCANPLSARNCDRQIMNMKHASWNPENGSGGCSSVVGDVCEVSFSMSVLSCDLGTLFTLDVEDMFDKNRVGVKEDGRHGRLGPE